MSERAVILYQKCLSETANAAERQELWLLLQQPAGEAGIKEQIALLLEGVQPLEDITDATMESMLRAIYEADTSLTNHNKKQQGLLRRITWIAAAAAAILLGWLVIRQLQPADIPRHLLPVAGYVAPGASKAVLTLTNGEMVILDSAGQREIAQGSAQVTQRGGQITYAGQSAGYNVLTTPRGGQFKVVLPDGTAVWLNAASSLRYPVAFTGNNRNVQVTGEAYFEVAANASKPFQVQVNGQVAVEVLGTSFNVNAYTDEKTVTTTLLEGAVRVVNGTSSSLLKPGQQASLYTNDPNIRIVGNADLRQAVAWKNGLFDFNKMPLEMVMRQLSRWYDIEVIYEKNIPDITFWGKMERDLPLSDVLLILEKSEVHFRIANQGKKLIVTP